MRRRGIGAIVYVSGRPAAEPAAGMAAYSLAAYSLSGGIRVNAVAPHLLDTARNRAAFPPQAPAHAVRPEAVANVIALLVGDLAPHISGAVLSAYGTWPGQAERPRTSSTPTRHRPTGAQTTISTTNRRSFLARGAAPAAVPTAAVLADGALAGQDGSRHAARPRTDPAVRTRSRRQRTGLLRRPGREEPVLDHGRDLPGGVPDDPCSPVPALVHGRVQVLAVEVTAVRPAGSARGLE